MPAKKKTLKDKVLHHLDSSEAILGVHQDRYKCQFGPNEKPSDLYYLNWVISQYQNAVYDDMKWNKKHLNTIRSACKTYPHYDKEAIFTIHERVQKFYLDDAFKSLRADLD